MKRVISCVVFVISLGLFPGQGIPQGVASEATRVKVFPAEVPTMTSIDGIDSDASGSRSQTAPITEGSVRHLIAPRSDYAPDLPPTHRYATPINDGIVVVDLYLYGTRGNAVVWSLTHGVTSILGAGRATLTDGHIDIESAADGRFTRLHYAAAAVPTGCEGCDLSSGLLDDIVSDLICAPADVALSVVCGAVNFVGGKVAADICERLQCNAPFHPAIAYDNHFCDFQWCSYEILIRNGRTHFNDVIEQTHWFYAPYTYARVDGGGYASEWSDPSHIWNSSLEPPIGFGGPDGVYRITHKHYAQLQQWTACAVQVQFGISASWTDGSYASIRVTAPKPAVHQCPGFRTIAT